MPIIKRCGDCGIIITDYPLAHDCPERRARNARLAEDRYRRRFLACMALLVGALLGIVMIWKWMLYE